jgi:hypothetical protein
MRKAGGQPGHQGKSRELVGPKRLDKGVLHLPGCCGCGHVFDGSEERVGDPVCHQQFELPVIRPLVFEHARLRLRLPGVSEGDARAAVGGCSVGVRAAYRCAYRDARQRVPALA